MLVSSESHVRKLISREIIFAEFHVLPARNGKQQVRDQLVISLQKEQCLDSRDTPTTMQELV